MVRELEATKREDRTHRWNKRIEQDNERKIKHNPISILIIKYLLLLYFQRYIIFFIIISMIHFIIYNKQSNVKIKTYFYNFYHTLFILIIIYKTKITKHIGIYITQKRNINQRNNKQTFKIKEYVFYFLLLCKISDHMLIKYK